MIGRFVVPLLLLIPSVVLADDPVDGAADESKPAAEEVAEEKVDGEQEPRFVLTEEVEDALVPLFSSIANAKVSRATVEMLSDSLIGGSVVESQKSTFQIASTAPDQFTIYLKEPEQRTRIYCDGKTIAVALAPDAYMRIDNAMSTQDAVAGLPVPFGPYPEPVLALTLAGVDPAISLIGGMKSIEIVDRDEFRGKTPSIHLRGVQADAVTWDFWISDDENSRPLRLLVDLTPMLVASQDLQVPEGYSYQVRFDFLAWRVTGEVEKELFVYRPPEDAKEYESLQAYYETMAGVVEVHPLLGKPAPPFKTTSLDGEDFDLKDLEGKVVVLDFWATWCTPCVAMMPVIKSVTDEYADKDVVFLALNTGEQKEEIDEFLKENELEARILLDTDGKVADAFATDAIPQTVVIGKSGAVESVHVGFPGEDALKQRLTDELDVLCVGGKIGSLEAEPSE